jgi:uncharacterized membrane protein
VSEVHRETGVARGGGKDPVARGLGIFSVALGVAQVTAPKRLSRLIGVEDDGRHGLVMRLRGVTEIASGVGILARPRPAAWLWSRVVGDVIDLALLLAAEQRRRSRVAAAMAAIAGVTVPDVLAGLRLSRNGDPADEGPVKVRKAITVNRPAHEVYTFWRDFENLPRFMWHLESVQTLGETRSRWRAKAPLGRSVEWEAEVVEERPDELIAWRSLPGAGVGSSGSVRFAAAPSGRGTEVIVELAWSPPGGTVGETLAKLLGEEPATQLADDLRRFKQVLETGEVVRSEATPEGHALVRHLKQRPAQPLETVEGGSR